MPDPVTQLAVTNVDPELNKLQVTGVAGILYMPVASVIVHPNVAKNVLLSIELVKGVVTPD